MTEDIYAKGRRIAATGGVRLADAGNRGFYFNVRGDTEDHLVRLMRDNTFNCTCTWGTLKGASHGSLCSHVVAAVIAASIRAAERSWAAAPPA